MKTDPRIPLKNPYLALFFGFLFPGGGHLYQGRTFKGVLYAVCIVSTFIYGMFLSDWTALYAGSPLSATGRRWGFIAQVPIGVPAVYALAQKRRYGAQSNVPQMGLDETISAPFQGVVRLGDYQNVEDGGELSQAISQAIEAYELAVRKARDPADAANEVARPGDIRQFAVQGQIELRPIATQIGPAVEGVMTGHLMLWNPETNAFDKPGEPIEFKLSSEEGRFEIDRKIYADERRSLRIDVVNDERKDRPKIGVLRGTIPRPLSDWFAVPLENEKLGRLHARLGKTYDLALVYTWIASLLNVLVLWDAFEGPAYGYGDEKPEGDADKPKDGKGESAATKVKPAKDPKTAATTA